MFYREKDTKKCGEGTEQNLLMDMTAKADCASGGMCEQLTTGISMGKPKSDLASDSSAFIDSQLPNATEHQLVDESKNNMTKIPTRTASGAHLQNKSYRLQDDTENDVVEVTAPPDAITTSAEAEQSAQRDHQTHTESKAVFEASSLNCYAEVSTSCCSVNEDREGSYFSPHDGTDGKASPLLRTFVTEVTCCVLSPHSSCVTSQKTLLNAESEAQQSSVEIQLLSDECRFRGKYTSEGSDSYLTVKAVDDYVKSTTELVDGKGDTHEQSDKPLNYSKPNETMEACNVLQNVENFDYFRKTASDLSDCGVSEPLYDAIISENTGDNEVSDLSSYEEQLLAMEEEMKQNKKEIEMYGENPLSCDDSDVLYSTSCTTNTVEDFEIVHDVDSRDITVAIPASPMPMATILEEDEEADSLENGECESTQDTCKEKTNDATPASHAVNRNEDLSSNDSEADCNGQEKQAIAAANQVNAVDVSDNELIRPSEVDCKKNSVCQVVVTKADVHAENCESIQSFSDTVFVEGRNTKITNSAQEKVSEFELAFKSVPVVQPTEAVECNLSRDVEETKVSQSIVLKSSSELPTQKSFVSTSWQNIETEIRDILAELVNQVDGNETTQCHQQQQKLPSTSGELTDGNGLASNNVAAFDESALSITTMATKDETQASSVVPAEHKDEEHVKVRSSSIEFFGVRPKNTTPTECSLTAKARCVSSGAVSSGQLTSSDNTCVDLEVQVGDLDGLSMKSAQVYVKLVLESSGDSGKSKRWKKTTNVRKCASSMKWKKQLNISRIPKNMLLRAHLTAAVWSKATFASSKPLCKCNVEMARQMRFSDGKEGVMSFSQRLLQQNNGWSDLIFYMS